MRMYLDQYTLKAKQEIDGIPVLPVSTRPTHQRIQKATAVQARTGRHQCSAPLWLTESNGSLLIYLPWNSILFRNLNAIPTISPKGLNVLESRYSGRACFPLTQIRERGDFSVEF